MLSVECLFAQHRLQFGVGVDGSRAYVLKFGNLCLIADVIFLKKIPSKHIRIRTTKIQIQNSSLQTLEPVTV